MTAFSDLPATPEHPLHPKAEQIHAYLEDYARTSGAHDRIRSERAHHCAALTAAVGDEPAMAGIATADPRPVSTKSASQTGHQARVRAIAPEHRTCQIARPSGRSSTDFMLSVYCETSVARVSDEGSTRCVATPAAA
jgi:hypothetical protein